ncbi:hypothetical protein EJ03DRAFT_52852 [Teratosphaeria nubilosa]|uniref:Uncharacterized protein n=1 Tax=Teratosphaeria nubilosa TaxID=161662 RepID=A0A6G1KT71_9PEZI|nr:hypothetical protein EJ03DRAFT_52852 [Teratosphaeria nubilosa]
MVKCVWQKLCAGDLCSSVIVSAQHDIYLSLECQHLGVVGVLKCSAVNLFCRCLRLSGGIRDFKHRVPHPFPTARPQETSRFIAPSRAAHSCEAFSLMVAQPTGCSACRFLSLPVAPVRNMVFQAASLHELSRGPILVAFFASHIALDLDRLDVIGSIYPSIRMLPLAGGWTGRGMRSIHIRAGAGAQDN